MLQEVKYEEIFVPAAYYEDVFIPFNPTPNGCHVFFSNEMDAEEFLLTQQDILKKMGCRGRVERYQRIKENHETI